MEAVIITLLYLSLLLVLGVVSNRFFKGTSADYFLASRGIGSFLLLMSLFGTTMTGFALVGSSGEAFESGIGVYGKMASSSGIIHSLCFFLIGIKLWSLGKRNGYMTQIQFFRDRFESDRLGLLLFPVLVGLVIPYLLVGVMSAGAVVQSITRGAFPNAFEATSGGIPFWLGSGTICVVVLVYVFFGGVRGTAWANAFQTIIFIILGVITFSMISSKLGGVRAATQMVIDHNPGKLQRAAHPDDVAKYELAKEEYDLEMVMWEMDPDENTKPEPPPELKHKPEGISQLEFLTYLFIPLSVGMFPHLFQHWLTARNANSFKLAVVAHPFLIMVVWVPCVLIGTWATSAMIDGKMVVPPSFSNPNAVLAFLVNKLTNPILGGFLTAGILAAIMSSLDSQFLCIGSIFTNDIFTHYFGKDKYDDRQLVIIGRSFVVAVVVVTYLIALRFQGTRGVFTLGIWCFSGFSSLFPLVVASLYWKRVTKAGAYASVLAAAGSWLWLFAQSEYGKNGDYLFLGMMPVATMVAASAAALIVVSLLTAPPRKETLARFFPDKKTAAA